MKPTELYIKTVNFPTTHELRSLMRELGASLPTFAFSYRFINLILPIMYCGNITFRLKVIVNFGMATLSPLVVMVILARSL